jgi:DNA-binding SARP family transcriptional activator
VIETSGGGYLLAPGAVTLDLDRFDELVREGRERLAAGDARAASERLGEALALWRGRPFAEFDGEPFARDAGARLEEARLAALEERIEADLALGRHAALVPELEELVRREPFRERPRAQLMLALYRSGRQADALDVYRRTRETLVDGLGVEPGPELQELERAILRHDRSLEARRPPMPAEPPATARRRPPLVGLTALVAVAAVAGGTAFALTRGGSSSGDDTALAPFVVKIENFLSQSREGRREAAATIDGATRCRLRRREAIARLNRVQRNRQSLLQQAAALSVPAGNEPLRASDLLQQAIQASIAADWRYRDWLVARKDCAAPSGPDYRAARAADVQAMRAKRQFVAVFNPLARRYGKRTWDAAEF